MPNTLSICSADSNSLNEADEFRRLFTVSSTQGSDSHEELRTTPLMTVDVKDAVERSYQQGADGPGKSTVHEMFPQYSLLGFHSGKNTMVPAEQPILSNTNVPSSTFICGSQGSGKSYTLSCILENYLTADRRLGKVGQSIAGLVFNYNPDGDVVAAETAYLASFGVPINVLVSQSNFYASRPAYERLPGAADHLTISPLLLHESHLSIERMHRLMAFSDKQTSVPLYMSVALRILRQMAMEAESNTFNYKKFKTALEKEDLTKDQLGPLHLRLDLLESFLDVGAGRHRKTGGNIFNLKPGTLTIVDLTDRFMDSTTACVLFEICLGLAKEYRPLSGLVVALDEAHKYMTNSQAAINFTEKLLGTIREQRHNATRVIIATQEPTISPKLMDLCTVSIVHRFTSPAWYTSIRRHLGSLSDSDPNDLAQDEMFGIITNLNVGESLVFSPSAFMCLSEAGVAIRLGRTLIKMKTRTRLSEDGGLSVLAQRRASGHLLHFQGIVDDAGSCFHSLDSTLVTREQRTATIGAQHEMPNRPKDKPQLDRSKCQLIVICCVCSSIVLIQSGREFLSNFPVTDSAYCGSGVGYATCIQCQLAQVANTKTALKQFDLRQGKAFQDGTLIVDVSLRRKICMSLEKDHGVEFSLLHHHNGEILYMFLRILQRSVTDDDDIWTVCIRPDDQDNSQTLLLYYVDGTFLQQPH